MPLLVIDVWEHSYYLKYRNRRGEFVDNLFNVINWDNVADRFALAKIILRKAFPANYRECFEISLSVFLTC
ncbi:MAG: hypothetical protein HC859_09265 [Bacteroidia bacterium]|nr:hypothetical protein [Bacteroidia bacterium]